MKNWTLISDAGNIPIGKHRVKNKDGKDTEASLVLMANGERKWLNGNYGEPMYIFLYGKDVVEDDEPIKEKEPKPAKKKQT